mmetsp:Transcript_23446/g.53514  ORF Transcript_23446/g.53514 Transcript_23446/m.53514 type:complete len:209 (+) Transcript_23446:35-661(+)
MGAVQRKTDRFERNTPVEDGCMALIQTMGSAQIFIQSDLSRKDAAHGRLIVRGTNGMIDTTESWVKLFNESSNGWKLLDLGIPEEEIDIMGGMANARLTKHLVNWINGGPESECSIRKAMKTLEVTMALSESARRNECMYLPLKEEQYPLELMISEGLLKPKIEGRYDIRAYLTRDNVDEKRYDELRSKNLAHHQIMLQLHMENQKHK